MVPLQTILLRGVNPSEKSFEDKPIPDVTANPEPVHINSSPGWRAYGAAIGGHLMMANCWGLITTYGAFLPYYQDHLLPDTDDFLLSLIGSTQSFLVLLFSGLVGRLLDAGFHRSIAITGSSLLTIGTLTLSWTSGDGGQGEGNYGLIWLTSAFIAGLGEACFFVFSSQNAAAWFPRSKSPAVGFTSSGAALGEHSQSLTHGVADWMQGGLVYPVMFKYTIGKHGFQVAVWCLFGAVSGTSWLAALLSGRNPDTRPRKVEKYLSLAPWWDTSAYANPCYRWSTAATCLVFFGFYSLPFFVGVWAEKRGLGCKEDILGGTGVHLCKHHFQTFWFVSIMNGCSYPGRLGGPAIAHRFGALNVYICSAAATSICCFLFWPLAINTAGAIAFCVLFGVFGGAVVALPAACVSEILAEKQERLGQWTGMSFTLSAAWSLAGPAIVGALVSQFGILAPGLWGGSSLLLAALCMAVARYHAGREGRMNDD